MNILVPNKRGAQFDLADLDISVLKYVEKHGNIYYEIEIRLLA